MICLETVTYIQFAAFIIYLSLAVYILSGKLQINQRIRLFLFSCCFAVASLEKVLVQNTCVSFEIADNIQKFTAIAWIASSPLAFLLTLGLSKFKKIADSKIFNGIILFYVVLITVLNWNGAIQEMHKELYGWCINNTGRLAVLYNIPDSIFVLGTILLLIYTALFSLNRIRQIQAKIIVGFAVISVLLMYVLKLKGQFAFISNSANLDVLLVVVGIVAAMNFYDFMVLTPAYAASSIFRYSSEIMMLMEPDGVIIEVNDALTGIMGLSKDGIKGKNISVLFADGEVTASKIVPEIVSEGNLISREVNLVKADKTILYGMLTASLLKRGGINAGIVCLITDITKLKKLDEIKSGLIDTLTHDLRTPVASIMGFVSILLHEEKDRLTPEQKDILATINNNAKRQLKLINNMLDVAKMEGSVFTLDKTKTDMVDIIENAVKEIRGVAEEKGIEIVTVLKSGGLILSADEFRMWQVIENLLGNAVKFSLRKTKVTLSAEKVTDNNVKIPGYADISKLERGEAEYVYVAVKDEGRGIVAGDLEKVFDRFSQFGESGDKRKGTGLGLTIVKNIIQAHDGAIWAESEGVDKGAQFKFILPFYPFQY
jgi:PAS domain S-box-containing protein